MKIWKKTIDYFASRILTASSYSGLADQAVSSHAGEIVTERNALSLAAVWACVRLLSGTISSLPLMVYREDSNGIKRVAKDHHLYRLLHDSPNAEQTSVDFLEYLFNSFELRGNMFARKEYGAGERLVALTPISPNTMQIRRNSNGERIYSWTEDGKNYVETSENVLHIPGFGGSPMGGLSTLSYARHTFGLALATNKAAGSTFRNGLRPSGAFVFNEFMTKEQREVAEDKLVEKFAGAINAGRPMILEGGTKFENITITPEDAQMLESRNFSAIEVCQFFGVPPFMAGLTEKVTSWGTGLGEQVLGFQKFTLRPRLSKVEKGFEKQLLTPQDRANGISIGFNLEGLLRGDPAARVAFYKEMTGIGAMTINRVRAKENEPPVAGGDVPRVQMQNVPITANDVRESK